LLEAQIPIDVFVIGKDEHPDTEEMLLRFPGGGGFSIVWASHSPRDFPETMPCLRVGRPGDADSIRMRRDSRVGVRNFNGPYDPRVRGARNAWVRRFLGSRASNLEFDLAPIRCVRWNDAEAMSGVIREIRAKSEAGHAALVAACVKEGLWPSADAIRKPTFGVLLDDRRRDKTTPLPETSEWTFTPR
jgi:hypothetical protein